MKRVLQGAGLLVVALAGCHAPGQPDPFSADDLAAFTEGHAAYMGTNITLTDSAGVAEIREVFLHMLNSVEDRRKGVFEWPTVNHGKNVSNFAQLNSSAPVGLRGGPIETEETLALVAFLDSRSDLYARLVLFCSAAGCGVLGVTDGFELLDQTLRETTHTT